jgi:anti-repressor protein
MNTTKLLSETPQKSLAQISVFENTYGKQCVSARELHERLEISDRFSRWFDSLLKYGFQEEIDFTSVKTSTLVNNGAERELQDYSITIEMAKQICMLQRSDKGREYREYFLNLEKAWNSPEAIMSRALQIANKTLEDAKNQVIVLQQKVEITEAKNEALASDVLTWADRKVIQAIINKYGANILDGNFQLACSDYKKELLYKYSINLNSRKTA